MNRTAFFASIRMSLFGGTLNQHQVDGMVVILDEWDRRALPDIRWLAYMLATTFHETAQTMQPIAEYGGPKTRYAPYYGRGFVQLTWQANYLKASALVGVDLVKNPDLAMLPKNAATIMFDGMIVGWFTGHKLADYIKGALCDYVQARRIINGTDQQIKIAGYAVSFQRALEAAAVSPQPQTNDQPVIMPAEPLKPKSIPLSPKQPDDPGVPAKPAQPSGFFDALAKAFAAIVAAIFPKG
jgi:putative chitinase